MTITYTLQKEDFLALLLYTASNTPKIKKRKVNAWAILTIGFAVAGYIFYDMENQFLAIYFWIIAVVTLLFYPMYFKRRYKRHYMKHISENYSNRFGREETMQLQSDVFSFKNHISDGNLKVSAITEINETEAHFFIKISSGESMGIPKSELTAVDAVREKFIEVGLTVNDQTDWKW